MNGVITDMVHWVCIKTVNATDPDAWYAPEQIVGEEEKNQILYVWIRGYFHVILRTHTATEDSCFVYLENNIPPQKYFS